MEKSKYSLSEFARQTIDNSPFIKSCLADGLINYSALARRLCPEIEKRLGKDVNLESLVVAIRRYADGKLKEPTISKEIAGIIANSSVSLQTNVSYAVVEGTRETIESVKSLLEAAEWELGEMRVVVQSAGKIFLLLKKSRMDELKSMLNAGINELVEDKAIISVRTPKEGTEAYGIIGEMANALARKGISIELVSVPPELHFIVEEGKSDTAYHELKGMIDKLKQ